MSKKSNNQGRAYEFVWIKILEKHLQEIIPVKIFQNSSLDANKNAYETLTDEQKKFYKISAESAIETIFELEPRIFKNLCLALSFLCLPVIFNHPTQLYFRVDKNATDFISV